MSYLTTGRKNAMYGTRRTGVRLVLTNSTDPTRVDGYSTWYDEYGDSLLRIGRLINDFRFEKTSATGDEADPGFAAVYDIATPEPPRPGQIPRPRRTTRMTCSTTRAARPAQWLEIFETDDPQPENAFAQALTAVGDHDPAPAARRQGSFRLVPQHAGAPLASGTAGPAQPIHTEELS